ncbi:hypothetical protein HPB50_003765 [Hyalomma asiaticum]|uniref:Uncharacterized protein n=1 Tax=Hyalomma asiaticum TaxID=266040 RepID=A0ACB7SX79_HYAAI|nr:hypothetical protein HPB50_003765 [Hyalomma asiaticum]
MHDPSQAIASNPVAQTEESTATERVKEGAVTGTSLQHKWNQRKSMAKKKETSSVQHKWNQRKSRIRKKNRRRAQYKGRQWSSRRKRRKERPRPGYKSSKKKHALFGVPKDEALFVQWRRAIPLADKLLQENSAVCELHFDKRYISRHFEHTVNGDIVRIERGRPLLLPGAS